MNRTGWLGEMPMHSKKPSFGVELRAGGDPYMFEKPGWSAGDMRQ